MNLEPISLGFNLVDKEIGKFYYTFKRLWMSKLQLVN